MPLPAKLLEQGVRDMVRICDGRMSGTAYGTVVLHVAPEAAAGGPLALVRTGDPIVLDVPAAGWSSTSPAEEWRGATPPGDDRGLPGPPAAGRACTWTTSCRPTPAPTSTSWSGPAAPR